MNLEDASIETSKTEMQRERERKKRNEKDKIFKNHWTIYRKCSMYVKGIQAHVGGGENKREYFKNNNIREFFKIRDRHQTTDPEN